MRDVLIAVAAGCVLLGLVFWFRTRITYRVGRQYLRVLLFEITLRKVALADITRISTRVRGPAEQWPNTHWPSHRQLVIHHTGSRRPLVITPANRYVVKAELERVIGRTEDDEGDDDTSFREQEASPKETGEARGGAARPQVS